MLPMHDYAGIWNCLMTLFQVCSAGSRLIVEDTVAERVIGKIRERMTHLRVGDSLDKVGESGVGGGYVVQP